MHASAAFAKSGYLPAAKLPKTSDKDWSKIIGNGVKADLGWIQDWGDLLEKDIFDVSSASKVLEEIENPDHLPLGRRHLEMMLGIRDSHL